MISTLTIPEVFNWVLINLFMHEVIKQVLKSSNKYIEFVRLNKVTVEDILPMAHSNPICTLEISYPMDEMSRGCIDFLVKLILGQKKRLYLSAEPRTTSF